MENTSCLPCDAGAQGEAGHSELREHFRSGGSSADGPGFAIYRCGLCGTLWIRRPAGGDYAWQRR